MERARKGGHQRPRPLFVRNHWKAGGLAAFWLCLEMARPMALACHLLRNAHWSPEIKHSCAHSSVSHMGVFLGLLPQFLDHVRVFAKCLWAHTVIGLTTGAVDSLKSTHGPWWWFPVSTRGSLLLPSGTRKSRGAPSFPGLGVRNARRDAVSKNWFRISSEKEVWPRYMKSGHSGVSKCWT